MRDRYRNVSGEPFLDPPVVAHWGVYQMNTSQVVSLFDWDGDPDTMPVTLAAGQSAIRLPDDGSVAAGWYWDGREWTAQGGLPPPTFRELFPPSIPPSKAV